jgi:hypothetical protein
MHRLEAVSHITAVRLHLHDDAFAALSHVPASFNLSLEALAIAGVVISMLLWTLVAIATPIPGMVSAAFRNHISAELRERLRKQTA